MKKLNFLILLLSIIGLQQQESYGQQVLDEQASKEDFSIYRDIAIELAPKLTKEDKEKAYGNFNKRIDELEDQSLTVLEFFRFMMEFETGVKNDEHAQIILPEEVFRPYLIKSKLFPIPIKIMEGQVIVNSTETEIPYGSIIQSINEMQVDSILCAFGYEKENTFAKNRAEEQFSLYYLLKIGASDEFDVEYKESLESATVLRKEIKGEAWEMYQKRANRKVYPLNKDAIVKQLTTSFIDSSKTACLQLNSFSWRAKVGNEYNTFKKNFKAFFNEIKNREVENLIIDLRYNGGGNIKIPTLLYSYLAEKEFKETVTLHMPDIDLPQKDHIIALDGDKVDKPKEIKGFIGDIKSILKEKDGKYVGLFRNEKKIKPKRNSFKGKVYLLIGGGSVSASSYFTSLFKAYERGTIVGEQIGGSHHDITAGKSITYELPNTKISVMTPLMVVRFSPEIYKKVPEKKIMPDIKLSINQAYQYFLEKKDADLEEVLKLIDEAYKP